MTTTRQDLARSLFTPLSRGAALFLLALGLVGAGPVASAQSTADAPKARSAQWQDHFDEQMARQLRQAPSLRASLIEVAIAQASKENAPSLSRTTEALLHVVDESPRQEHRVLAVQALSVIGPELAGDGPRPCAVIGEAHVRQCETCQAASKMPAPPHREAGTRRGGHTERRAWRVRR